MTLILDVDGVIADFCSAVDDIVRDLDPSYTPTWRHWEIKDNLPPGTWPIVKFEMCAPGFAYNLSSFPGAVDAVCDALDDGLDIVFGTTPMPGSRTWADDRKQWLIERFGPVDVVSLDQKWRLRGDALCDDKPEHLHEWPTQQRYLVDRPYNKNSVGDFRRVPHVRDAIALYREMTNVPMVALP